jgi:predicted RNA-binding Zn-ribbon protein involved in translation (DUF1610 family)
MSKVQQSLNRLYKECKTWKAVSDKIGVNRGIIWGVIHGTRKPTPKLCKVLGLPVECKALVSVCPKCGQAKEAKRCPHCRKARAPEDKAGWAKTPMQKYVLKFNG